MAQNSENSLNTDNVTSRVTEAVGELAQTQKYFNNIIDDSVNNLTKVAGEYNKIKGLIDKAKEGELGLFKLGNSLLQAKINQIKEAKKLDDIEKSISNAEKIRARAAFNFINRKERLEKEYYEAIKKGDQNKVEGLRRAI